MKDVAAVQSESLTATEVSPAIHDPPQDGRLRIALVHEFGQSIAAFTRVDFLIGPPSKPVLKGEPSAAAFARNAAAWSSGSSIFIVVMLACR